MTMKKVRLMNRTCECEAYQYNTIQYKWYVDGDCAGNVVIVCDTHCHYYYLLLLETTCCSMEYGRL
jgi:hypothetical protein